VKSGTHPMGEIGQGDGTQNAPFRDIEMEHENTLSGITAASTILDLKGIPMVNQESPVKSSNGIPLS
jgi:hypothetical protein